LGVFHEMHYPVQPLHRAAFCRRVKPGSHLARHDVEPGGDLAHRSGTIEGQES